MHPTPVGYQASVATVRSRWLHDNTAVDRDLRKMPSDRWTVTRGILESMQYLHIVEPAEATGALAEVYERMGGRPMPPIYRPAHGGIAGIVRAHSLDPGLMPKAFGFSGGVNQAGPLAWPHRELVAAATSRLNQCFY
jgi:hypothetical protein